MLFIPYNYYRAEGRTDSESQLMQLQKLTCADFSELKMNSKFSELRV